MVASSSALHLVMMQCLRWVVSREDAIKALDLSVNRAHELLIRCALMHVHFEKRIEHLNRTLRYRGGWS